MASAATVLSSRSGWSIRPTWTPVRTKSTMTKVDGFATGLGASDGMVWNLCAVINKDVTALAAAIDPIGPGQ